MKKFILLILTVIMLFRLDLYSQGSTQIPPQKRIALVIGNGNYNSSVLANPENDARAMKIALESTGFSVLKYENLNQSQMKKAIDDFGEKLKGNDVGLFFYAGHGIQSKGYNYLIPVDAQLKSEQQIEYDCVQADRVLALMEASGAKVNILILDACRNNPFERSWTRSATSRGLAFMNAPGGTLIAYATSPGSTASDGGGRNGLYTSAILESMKIPNITIIQMFQNVRGLVSQKSNKQQIPWESTSLTGDFYFTYGGIIQPEVKKTAPATIVKEATSIALSDYIIDSRDKEQYRFVKIGNQVWFAENLRATKFNDGTGIPLIDDKKTWRNLSSPAYCFDKSSEGSLINVYGLLYNWYAVNTGKLCPTGWHVPTHDEWIILADYLGGENVAGSKLKETGTTHWKSPNTGATNESGFTALPGGIRNLYGNFVNVGIYGNWWSDSEYDATNAIDVGIAFNSNSLSSGYLYKNGGFSVRCLKDF